MRSEPKRIPVEAEREIVVWSDPGYETVVRIVHERSGLIFSPGRRSMVEETIHRVMARAGIRDLLCFAGAVKTESTLRDELISELTVGETYFFRESEQLGFIRREVVPSLLRGRPEGRTLRVWSAGCATGEEPYSLAILFYQLGLSASTRILGTDISPPRLEAARRARYSRWSFRGVPKEVVGAYFNQRGAYLELAPRLRNAVEFRWLNLAGDRYPSPETGIGELDLVLCRNVLIYFDADTVAAVAERLIDSLSEDGWLFLGAADPPLADIVPCTVVSTGSGLAYRRPGRGGQSWRQRVLPLTAEQATSPAPSSSASSSSPLPPPPPLTATPVTSPPEALSPSAFPPAPLPSAAARIPASSAAGVGSGTMPEGAEAPTTASPTPPADDTAATPGTAAATPAALGWRTELGASYLRGDYQRVTELAARWIGRGCWEGDEEGIWTLWVLALANQGRLEEAGRVCAGGLDRHRLSVELAYLHSVLLAQAGRYVESAIAARRALYLDRGLVMAHLALARALTLQGDRAGARRSLENALRLLSALPEEAVVPASDGRSAASLSDLVRAQLHLLGGIN